MEFQLQKLFEVFRGAATTGSIPRERFTYVQRLLPVLDSDTAGLSLSGPVISSRRGSTTVESKASIVDSPTRSASSTTPRRSLTRSTNPRRSLTPVSNIVFLNEVASTEFQMIAPLGCGQVSFAVFKAWILRLLGQGDIAARRDLLEQLNDKLRRALLREETLFALEVATTLSTLKAALVKATPVLSKQDVAPFQTRLAEMARPFPIRLSTLAGDGLDLDVSRSDLVGSIRGAVAKHFGVEAYRVALATEAGCLQPDSAPLDAFLGPAMPVTIAIEEAISPPGEFERLLKLFTQDVQRTTAELQMGCRKSELIRADIVHLLAN